MRGWSRVMRRAFALPKFMIFELPPCIWFKKKNMTNTNSKMGNTAEMTAIHGLGPEASTLYVTSGWRAISEASVSLPT